MLGTFKNPDTWPFLFIGWVVFFITCVHFWIGYGIGVVIFSIFTAVMCISKWNYIKAHGIRRIDAVDLSPLRWARYYLGEYRANDRFHFGKECREVPSGQIRYEVVQFLKSMENDFWLEFGSIKHRDMVDIIDEDYDFADYDLKTNLIHYIRFKQLLEASHYEPPHDADTDSWHDQKIRISTISDLFEKHFFSCYADGIADDKLKEKFRKTVKDAIDDMIFGD